MQQLLRSFIIKLTHYNMPSLQKKFHITRLKHVTCNRRDVSDPIPKLVKPMNLNS